MIGIFMEDGTFHRSDTAMRRLDDPNRSNACFGRYSRLSATALAQLLVLCNALLWLGKPSNATSSKSRNELDDGIRGCFIVCLELNYMLLAWSWVAC